MPVIRTDINETWEGGKLVTTETVEVDVTTEVVTLDLHDKVRTALVANAAYLELVAPTAAQNTTQVRRLTRQVNALVRLVLASDLLTDNADT